MNVTITGSRSGMGINNINSIKVSAANSSIVNKAKNQVNSDEKNDKRNNNTAAVLSLSNVASNDRSKEITKRFQSMKENIQNQIDALNERLQKASELGNTEMEEQLTESIKELSNDFSALDEQLKSALFEEQQRKAEEAKIKDEEAAKKKEKELEKYKSDEERIKIAEKKTFEFFTKSDIAKDNIENSKLQKAKLERTKGRLEGEMAIDAANGADKEQRHLAGVSKANNGGRFSFVPHVSDKTILTERKRIANGQFTPDENPDLDELNKLSRGIENLENSIAGEIAALNEAITERAEDAKENFAADKKPEEKDEKANIDKKPEIDELGSVSEEKPVEKIEE